MPTATASRTIALPLQELWEVIADPHHLPRWWPLVTRVEDVGESMFTEVMKTSRGRLVRADFDVVGRDDARHVLRWAQRVEGTPFARVLAAAETEVRLDPAEREAEATQVTLELRQAMRGFFSRFGTYMVRRAAAATLEEALNGLERIGG